ncbi:hypothetical protein CBR_g10950 [Chara braunii]|uniref:Uncharacterized protein n=1 Tax=Chara braunii TaxID=69332 RepID=A0A388KPN0_CHABU|nr:hypothetical protein CBR_g10950 [Chara braunii]|eukprot:GBG72014.1 hypothetical protein CBR_g10950 [Chara braunii]
MRRAEGEKKTKEEEERRKNQDFARKIEELRLQLRMDLNKEWRQREQEATAAVKSNLDDGQPTVKNWKDRKCGRKGKKSRRGQRSDSSESSDSESESEWDSTLSTSSKEDGSKGRGRRKKGKERTRGAKKKITKPKDRKKVVSPVNLTPRFERGECSKHCTSGLEKEHGEQRPDEEDRDEREDEPKTPLTGGYKGLSAGCSQKGLIEYCISAHKIYSGKSALDLRKLCDKKGIRYTKKPEVVELLTRQQVELAYEGFEEKEGEGSADKKGKGKAQQTPKAEIRKDQIVHEHATRWREHCRNARNYALGLTPHLYRRLRSFGLEKYVLLLIRHTEKDDDYAYEKFLIANFCPSLNSRDIDKREVRRRRKVRKGRRERKGRSAGTAVREAVIGRYQESSFASLFNWLNSRCGTGEVHKVVDFSKGALWIDGWKVIRRTFGETRLLIAGSRMRLKHAKENLQKGGTVVFLRIVKMKTTTEKNNFFLAMLLRRPKPSSQLANLTTNKLVGLYWAAGCFAEKKTKLALRWKIDSAIRRKTGIGVRRRITVKLRYDSDIRKRGVREMVEQVVDGKVQEKAVAGFMKTRIRVVWLRNRTVGQLLHNQKVFAMEEEFSCGCSNSSLPKMDGHGATRFAELPEVPQFLRNSKNITRSSRALNGDTLVQAVLDATKHIQGITPKIVVPEGTIAEERGTSVAWTDDEVKMWSKKLSGLVLVPVDRNQGDTAVFCPVLYRHAFGKVFL